MRSSHVPFILIGVLSSCASAWAKNPSFCDKSGEEWIAYVASESGLFPSNNFTQVSQQLSSCWDTIRSNGYDRCLGRLHDFAEVKAKSADPAYSMGFSVPTDQYYKQHPKDGSMDLPKEFADGLPDDWEDVARKNGWKYARYESKLVAARPHGTHTRILFQVPNPNGTSNTDQWIQVTVPKNPGDPQEQIIDMITVKKGAAPDGNDQIYFKQFWRDEKGKHPVAAPSMASNCYSCHPNGMRELHPNLGSVPSISPVAGDDLSGVPRDKLLQARVDQFNKKMSSYSISWGDTLNRKSHGPPLGMQLGSKYNCTGCHDGSYDRGPLTGTTNLDHIRFKMLVEKSMPPNVTLTDAERQALYDKLVADRNTDTKAWLKTIPCSTCNDQFLNSRIGTVLQTTPDAQINLSTLTKALAAATKQDSALANKMLDYAKKCDATELIKIAHDARNPKGVSGPKTKSASDRESGRPTVDAE